jgi:hypothetical protein
LPYAPDYTHKTQAYCIGFLENRISFLNGGISTIELRSIYSLDFWARLHIVIVMLPDLLHQIKVFVAPQAEAHRRVAVFVPEPNAFRVALGEEGIVRAESTHLHKLLIAMLWAGQKFDWAIAVVTLLH